MSTQGVGTFAINSFWESGRLIFYEKAYGHTTTGDVFILGADYVQVGDTANDVNFVWDGSSTGTFTLDAGAHTLAMTGLATSTDGAVTITNATATSSTTTGALIVTGGIATAADIWCGDDLFFASGAVINFDASDVTLTHAANLLTLAGGGMGFGIDGTGVDVTFYGDTESAQVLWDMSDDALEFTGVAKCKFGVSGTELVYVAGTPIFTLYSTAAGAGTTNCEPFYVYSILTGTSPVGGRSRFHTYANVTCGGWINALKSYLELGASGKVTGLASSSCIEMKMPNANMGAGGAYFPLEIEYVAGGTSTVTAGSLTGNHAGFMYLANSGDADGDFDDNGYLMHITGLTSSTGHLFFLDNAAGTVAGSLRIGIGDTAYYILLYSNQVQHT